MNRRYALKYSFAIIAGSYFLNALKSIILIPIITKNISVDSYGIWVQALAFVSFILPLMSAGLPSAIVRFLPGVSGKKFSTIFFSSELLLLLIWAVVASICYLAVSHKLIVSLDADYSAMLFIYLLSELLLKYSINYFRIREYIVSFGVFSLVSVSIETALIYYIFTGSSTFSAAFMFLAMMKFIYAFIINLFVYVNEDRMHINFNALKPLLWYGLPLVPIVSFELTIQLSDRFLIGMIENSKSVGVYSAHYSIAYVMVLARYISTYIPTVKVFESYDRGEKNDALKIIQLSLKVVFTLCVPATAALVFVGDKILTVLTTSNYLDTNTTIIFLLLSIGVFAYNIEGVISTLLLASKKSRYLLFAYSSSAVINIILNVLLIPVLHIVGAAISTTISYIILLVISMIGIDYSVKDIFKGLGLIHICASASVMSVVLIFTQDFLVVPVMIFVSVILYFSTLLLFSKAKA